MLARGPEQSFPRSFSLREDGERLEKVLAANIVDDSARHAEEAKA